MLLFTQQPDEGDLITSYSNFFVTVQDDELNTAIQKDYKFILRIKQGDDTLTTMHANPHPGTQFGVFNLSPIKDYVNTSFPFSDNIIESYPETCKEFYLELTNHYNQGGSWFDGDEVSGNTFFVLDAAKWRGDDYYKYKLGNNVFSKFLNNRNEFTTYPTFPDLFLYYFNDQGQGFGFELNTYNINGELLESEFIVNPYYEDETVQRINVGYRLLQELDIADNVAFYTITAQNESEDIASETVTVSINKDCFLEDKPVMLFWLTHTGAYNCFLFKSRNVPTTTKQTESYKRNSGKLIDGQFIIEDHSPVNSVYYTRLEERLELNAPWLSDEDSAFIKELVTSPLVYIQDKDGKIYAGVIENDNYEELTATHTPANHLKLTFKYSQDQFQQGT